MLSVGLLFVTLVGFFVWRRARRSDRDIFHGKQKRGTGNGTKFHGKQKTRTGNGRKKDFLTIAFSSFMIYNRRRGETVGKRKQKKSISWCDLSSSPSNEKIIRTAAQMAQAFQAGFTALYVQTAEKTEKTPEDLARLQKHVRLAEQSGAEIVTTHSEDIALQIAEYARISEVTRIVIGKSMMKQGYFHQRRVWTERLTDLVPDLEIHIIPDSDVYRRYQKRKKFPEWMELPSWKELMLTVLILAAATGIGEIFFRLGFTDANIITVYLFGVMLTSILTSGYTCSVVSSVASVVLFNYFMTEPRLSLHAYGSGYPVTFAIMLGTSILTSTLASKLKENAKLSARDAFRTKILFNTSQLLQKVEDASENF